jgi:hypothetical protein
MFFEVAGSFVKSFLYLNSEKGRLIGLTVTLLGCFVYLLFLFFRMAEGFFG